MSETAPEPVDTSAADPDPITTDVSQDPNWIPQDFSGEAL